MRASWHIGFGRPLVEFSGRPLARWSAPGFAAACARLMIAWRALFTVVFTITGLAIAGLAVARGQLDFEFVEFVPLGLGALAVGYGQELLQAAAGRNRLRCIHPRIIPLFQNGCFAQAVPDATGSTASAPHARTGPHHPYAAPAPRSTIRTVAGNKNHR